MRKLMAKMAAMVLLQCPSCHQQPLFSHRQLWKLNTLYDMPKHCPNCGQDFEPEIGYYWGAMYVGYGVCVGIMFGIMGISLLCVGTVPRWVLWLSIAIVVFTFPYLGRLSRSIWIHLFVGKKKE